MLRPSSFLPCSSLLSRRDVLRVGAISAAASLTPAGWGADAQTGGSRPPLADSVIFLWMGGGVTHIDSFDPKPQAPEEIRGTLSAISTNIPGVQFGEKLPRLVCIRINRLFT